MLDPDPGAAWPATYGAWADELPADLPADVAASRTHPTLAVGRSGRALVLDRSYVMLDNARLAAHLRAGGQRHRVGTVRHLVRADGGVGAVGAVLADGSMVRARVVVDATGARRRLVGDGARGPRAAQTAVGVVVDRPLPTAFMDWREDHGRTGWPTFLYVVDLGEGRTLLEETSLARRPGLPLAELRTRLDARLRARGIAVPPDAPVEHVAFPVDLPPAGGSGPVFTFGASAPLGHPATGYSLAAALRQADPVAEAITTSIGAGGVAAAAAARHVVWSPTARAVHHLRRRGLEALLALPPEGVGDFFELFLGLPVAHQRAYLSSRDDLVGVTRAMAALFAAADGPLRRHLMRWGGAPTGLAPPPPGVPEPPRDPLG